LFEEPLAGSLQRIKALFEVGGDPVFECPPEVFNWIGFGRATLRVAY